MPRSNVPMTSGTPTSARRRRPAASGAPWPTIVVRPGELHRVLDESENALLTSGREFFQRGGLVVRPVLLPYEATHSSDAAAPRRYAHRRRALSPVRPPRQRNGADRRPQQSLRGLPCPAGQVASTGAHRYCQRARGKTQRPTPSRCRPSSSASSPPCGIPRSPRR